MIWINDTLMPTPDQDGFLAVHHNLWSKNTGRTTSAKMVGDIVAKKWELTINWDRLTAAEIKIISTAINAKPFFPVKFPNPENEDADLTKTFLLNADFSFPFSIIDDYGTTFKSVTLNLVEQ